MDAPVRPLSAEDLNILALENAVVAGHTCKVIMLREGISAARLRAMLASRISRAPELSMRLETVEGAFCWVPTADIDLEAHVVACETGGAVDGAGLRREVARIFAQRLNRSRPLWQVDVVGEMAGGGGALVWRIHHALADGATAMRIANAVMWETPDRGSRAPPAGSTKGRVQTGVRPESKPADRWRSGALATAVREAPRPWRRSPFDGSVGSERSIAFASAGLASLRRAIAAVEGATVNDGVLSLVAGGLQRWLEERHGSLRSVRVKVPVSLHGAGSGHGGAHEPGNRDSFFCVDMPLGPHSPLERVAAIRDSTRVRKDCHDAEHIDALTRELGAASPRLRRFADRALVHPRSFALNVSNVRGPAQSVQVDRVSVRGLYSLAEIGERHALRVAVVSFAGVLGFGLCADPSLLPDVERIAHGIEAESAALTDSVVAI